MLKTHFVWCLAILVVLAGCDDNAKRSLEAKDAREAQQATALKLEIPLERTLDLGNGVTMKLVLIPSGKFLMGSPDTDEDADADEKPQHEVTISKPFYLGVTEVTQAQWKAMMGTDPWKGKRHAKDGGESAAAANWISWDDATAFCKALAEETDQPIRLPTEAEWEYACRGGTTTRFSYAADSHKNVDYSPETAEEYWRSENGYDWGEYFPHPVGKENPNPWGLHDIYGNVWEWCSDWYDEKYYSASGNATDPTGPSAGDRRVLRGGAFRYGGRRCRSAERLGLGGDKGGTRRGFRVVVPLGPGVD